MKIKKEILDRCITFEDHIMQELQDSEMQKEYLRLNIEEYVKSGDYTLFFKALERVMNRSNLSNILKGKVQPSFYTTMKILRGLGAEIEVKFA